ncbi:MAG: PAS domain S-box protein [Hyphomicrobiaceae bacterium]|nr:PAS domain S-box protein [Hyphomicrobiaceae bacterium]
MTATGRSSAETERLRLKAILDSAVAAILTIDSSGRIETVNRSAERLFGYTGSELAGHNVSMLMPEPYSSQHDGYIARYLATGERRIIGIGREVQGLRRDGSIFPMHLSIGEYSIGGERFFTGIVYDLSAQRAIEDRLDREQALFRSIFDSLPDAVVISDTGCRIRLVNPAFTEAFGYLQDEVVGKSCGSLCESPQDAERFGRPGSAAVGSGPQIMQFRRSSGQTFPARAAHLAIVDRNGNAIGGLALIHDVTAERQQAAALLQAQRMEAVGQLTGGVAHDFNNLLTVILGNIELLEPKLEAELSISLASEAREAAEMGARLTDRLLTFARRQRLETCRIDLNEFVLNLTELLRRTIGTDIDLSTSLAADLWSTEADPGQIENAVLNLAINARDAMPGGGRLVIETRNTPLDAEDVAHVPGLAAGDFVVLSVADTGEGMAPEVKERAFEPFFTTKGPSKGSGLGLSTIYGFARQSGGNITIYSEPGHGTTVNLYLPRARAPGAGSESSAAAASTADASQGEAVLVVEDDDRVRRLTATRLKQLGYRVHEAANGQEALAVLAEAPGIDLVFSDLVMPGGMSGLDLARRVRDEYPGTRLVLTSGYSAELIGREKVDGLGLKVLRKPYRQAQLARVLREALEDGKAR